MNDDSKDIGLVIADAFQLIRRNPSAVERIEAQTDNALIRAEKIAKLVIEQLYDANIIRMNVGALRKELRYQADQLATLGTELKPTNRAEFVAMALKDAIEDSEQLAHIIGYLSADEKRTLWEHLSNSPL